MSLLTDIEALLTNQFALIKTFFSMLTLEAKIAQSSIVPLLISLWLLALSLLTLWGASMVMMAYLIYLWCHTFWISIMGVIVINMTMIVGLFRYIATIWQAMRFAKSRAYLFPKQGASHATLKKTTD